MEVIAGALGELFVFLVAEAGVLVAELGVAVDVTDVVAEVLGVVVDVAEVLGVLADVLAAEIGETVDVEEVLVTAAQAAVAPGEVELIAVVLFAIVHSAGAVFVADVGVVMSLVVVDETVAPSASFATFGRRRFACNMTRDSSLGGGTGAGRRRAFSTLDSRARLRFGWRLQ